MNLVHLSILAGLATVSIPLLLHMLGKRQPQLVDFPALRFVRQTQQDHSKSWKLRHFLLLLLRVLLLAVLVFALARPRVHSAAVGSIIGISGLVVFAIIASLAAAIAWASRRPLGVWLAAASIAVVLWIVGGLWGYQAISQSPALPTSDTTAPVAVAVILDTSPSMNYVYENKTRLDAAKDVASWLLGRMPVDSHVGVLTGVPLGSLSQSPAGASTQISRIERTTERVDLLDRIRLALNLVLDDPLERREIYVLTDMNSAAWGAARDDLIKQIQEVQGQVLIQLVDVGAPQPTNWQLGDPKVDFNTVPVDGDVTIRIPITQSTDGKQTSNSVTVEMWQESIDPKLPVISNGKLQLPESKVAARQVVDFSADGTSEVELVAKKLAEGTHHFSIKLDKNDPLSIDNQRFVSISAVKQQPTLIVSNSSDAARVLSLLLEPNKDPASQSSVSTVSYAQLPQAALIKYSVIVMFDPGPLSVEVVQALKEHVAGGRGLMIILGRGLETQSGSLDNTPIAELMPGTGAKVLTRPTSDRQVFLVPSMPTHPVFQDLEYPANEVAWQLMPVYRNWAFDALRENVQVLAMLNSIEKPLLTIQNIGQGQLLTLTTPLPEFEQAASKLWNELWISEQFAWTFGVLSGCMKTLSGANQSSITFTAGSSVTLLNDPNLWPKKWELYTPNAERLSIEANNGLLAAGSHGQAGIYHLRANRGGAIARGFSVNVSAADTVMQRIDSETLDTLLGGDAYRIAKKQDEIESSVGQARFGQELYPLLMLFVAGIFLAEQVMSNRFYKIQLRLGKATS